jgi:hypothetical protein
MEEKTNTTTNPAPEPTGKIAPEAQVPAWVAHSSWEISRTYFLNKIQELGQLLYQERSSREILERQMVSKSIDYESYTQLYNRWNRLSSFVAHQYIREIRRGEHAGHSLSEIIEHYLLIERRRWRVRLADWLWLLSGREGD